MFYFLLKTLFSRLKENEKKKVKENSHKVHSQFNDYGKKLFKEWMENKKRFDLPKKNFFGFNVFVSIKPN